MKTAIIITLLIASIAYGQDAPEPLVLTNVANVDIRRIDEGPRVHVMIRINLVSGPPFITDYYISEADVDAFKDGTNPEKAAIRRKYIRQAVKAYLATVVQSVTVTDQGSQNVSKANIAEPGDTP